MNKHCVRFLFGSMCLLVSGQFSSLTVLVAVVGPVWTLIRIISRNAELQRRNAREVFIV